MNFPFSKNNTIISSILENRAVDIYFQPIVSVRTKSIFAYESLTRCKLGTREIPPDILFEMAKSSHLLNQLDEMTRQLAIEKFKSYYERNNDLLLFLNIESEIINSFRLNNKEAGFIQVIKKAKIPFKNFVLEIKEDEIGNITALEEFCRIYKEMGFSIALDDFGTGSSNFYRLNIIKPDILKIDRSLFSNTSKKLINKEIIKSISNMCQNLGIRALAEGVEDFTFVKMGLKAGINLFQGYLYSKPKYEITREDEEKIITKLINSGNKFKKFSIENLKNKREIIDKFNVICSFMIENKNSIKDIYEGLKENYIQYSDIEAMYLINASNSKQIYDTILEKRVNSIYKPTENGDEHFLKDYFYITLESKQGIYLSQKYISYASGSVCKTFAKKFNLQDESYIICLDIVIEGK